MTDHRTYGETRDCKGCRFWSEMIAKSDGNGVEAMCLNSTGPKSQKYTVARSTCDGWRSGHFGAVDEPPNYGEQTRALYAAEDGIR